MNFDFFAKNEKKCKTAITFADDVKKKFNISKKKLEKTWDSISPGFTWISRLGTREAPPKRLSTCIAAPCCQGCRCKSSTPDTQEKLCAASLQRNQNFSPPLQVSYRSHHHFLHHSQRHGNIYPDMSHGTAKAVKLRANPS